jgi:hypothetical protein
MPRGSCWSLVRVIQGADRLGFERQILWWLVQPTMPATTAHFYEPPTQPHMSDAATPQVLLVGTGLHRQLGVRADSPLVCWRRLLEAAAIDSGLPEWRASCHDSYSLAWERLVLTMVKCVRSKSRGATSARDTRLAAADAERRLRESVAHVLRRQSTEVTLPPASRRGVVVDALTRLQMRGPLHIIDFNFDSVLLQLLGQSDPRLLKWRPNRKDLSHGYSKFGLRRDDIRSLRCRVHVSS